MILRDMGMGSATRRARAFWRNALLLRSRRCILSAVLLVAAVGARAAGPYSVVPDFGGVPLIAPVQLVFEPGPEKRAFVVELPGRIAMLDDSAAGGRRVILDLSTRVHQGKTEHGMVSLAFHPGFSRNGFLYIWTSIWEAGARSMRLLRFTMSAAAEVDPASELEILRQPAGAGGHDGGTLLFGGDGFLYISVGDGDTSHGASADVSADQRIDGGWFGGVLRIDVDHIAGSIAPHPRAGMRATHYWIPADNPFIGSTTFNGQPVAAADVRTEFWAVGLRNPFRMSLDPATREIWIGDVGEGAREEIDLLKCGANYGWNFLEGSAPGPNAGATPKGAVFAPPAWEYTHAERNACITGGVVYRGKRFPELQGAYIFADYVSGRIWAAANSGARPFQASQVTQIAMQPGVVGITVRPGTGDILLVNIKKGLIQKLDEHPPQAPSGAAAASRP